MALSILNKMNPFHRLLGVLPSAFLGSAPQKRSVVMRFNKHDANDSNNGALNDDRYGDNGIGCAALVGAGPGDPELLTLKALKAIERADVVLFDSLVSEDILKLIPRTTPIEYVGKRAGKHSILQKDICKRLVELSLQGKYVVRLKGGDPAIFARTAEETQALEAHNIPFSIIPGITAASGASAYSGIPLTHRDCAQSVRFVTATMKHASEQPQWGELACALSYQTLVFYMGLSRLPMICSELIDHKVDKSMPIALVENATCDNQRVIVGTLRSIQAQLTDEPLSGPTLIVVGKVVAKRSKVVDINALLANAAPSKQRV